MRVLLVFALAACGAADGALLTINAPDGVGGAERVAIVLASADEEMIVDLGDQRATPGDTRQEPVRYYRQRALAGEVGGISELDGFQLRLEPDPGSLPDPKLIPLLIALDANNVIIGIAARLGDDGTPAEVEIAPGELLGYEVVLAPLTETAGSAGIAAGEVMRVSCGDTDSGLAWLPEQPGAIQLRLLFPDDGTGDASGRALDLDCDTVEATARDCDDLRAEFHPGATEECDGQDFDCDSNAEELVICHDIATSCGSDAGLQLCRGDTSTASASACLEDPVCTCQGGDCADVCTIPFVALDPGQKLCEPYASNEIPLGTDCGNGCKVEVLDQPGNPWRVLLIDFANSGQLVTKLDAATGSVDLHLRNEATDVLMANGPGAVVGAFYLAVTPIGTQNTILVSHAIKLGTERASCATPTQMFCQ